MENGTLDRNSGSKSYCGDSLVRETVCVARGVRGRIREMVVGWQGSSFGKT